MGHDHGHHHASSNNTTALGVALLLNGGFLLIEAGVGWWSGSLALLSDAAHMLSDVGGLILALLAARLAARGPGLDRTYGLGRAEVLGAFVNALLLVVASMWLVSEAIERLAAGAPQVPGGSVFVVAAIGLGINLGSAWMLMRADQDNPNIRGALLHMVADALGSVGAMAGAAAVIAGYPIGDPIASLVIVALIVSPTLDLLRSTGWTLMERPPPEVDTAAIQATLADDPRVLAVHDAHVWSIDGRAPLVTAHLVLVADANPFATREAAETRAHDAHGIEHLTLQVEQEGDGCTGACEEALDATG